MAAASAGAIGRVGGLATTIRVVMSGLALVVDVKLR